MFFETYDEAVAKRDELGGWMHYKVVTHHDNRRNCYEVVAC